MSFPAKAVGTGNKFKVKSLKIVCEPTSQGVFGATVTLNIIGLLLVFSV